MNIIFDHVVPAFMAGTAVLGEQVWGAQVEIPAGRRVLVRAQSGRGKTTLLSYLYGTRTGYTGSIRYGDRDIARMSAEQWSVLRQGEVSMVFQDLRLFDHLTVRENLAVKSNLQAAMSAAEIADALTRLGVGQYMDRECRTLSMGQQQRVAIVRALIQPFHWLLMDEPFSHIDEVNTGIALTLIQEVCAQRGAGYIISSLGAEHSSTFDQILEL